MAANDFAKWFCLKAERRNFSIDPLEDNSCLFGDPEEDANIKNRLHRAQLLSVPVRLVWLGQYGIGKTHRLRHTSHTIKANEFRYRPYYVVCGDIDDKTRFDRLHYQLVNTLEREPMRQLVTEYLLRIRNGEPLPKFDEICGTSSDAARAFENFGSGNPQLALPAWQFLCGLTLKGNEIQLAGVTKPALNLTNDYVAVLATLATIFEKQTGDQLFYLIDETEKLTRVTNKAAEAAWNETLRAMLDIKNLNVIMTVGAEKTDQLPTLLMFPDIVRRIQRDNYIMMEAFSNPLAEKFVKQMLTQWVDPLLKSELEVRETFAGSIDSYESGLYPFANPSAFNQFIENMVVDPREAKPSVILDKLNMVAVETMLQNERLISCNLLSSFGYA